MLRILNRYNEKEKESFLANMALTMMPHVKPGSESAISDKEREFRQNFIEELYKKLKLEHGDDSRQARAMIYDFISKALSKIVLQRSDLNKIKDSIGDKGLLRNDSYKIVFPPYFKKYGEIVGLRVKYIEDAVHHPDTYCHLLPEFYGNASNKLISLYLKTPIYQKSNDIYSILVLTDRLGATQSILDAWRIYHSDVNISSCQSAIDVLKAFIDKYCIEFDFLSIHKTKFILYEKIAISNEKASELLSLGHEPFKLIKYNRKEGCVYNARFLFGIMKGEFSFFEVAIALVLDINKFTNDLKRHGVQIPNDIAPFGSEAYITEI